ncbi:uncharacterized protein LY89DRAFT_681800 [Mollisia scopiformis]|uniref:Fungal N-terminal domain-containing protein n=1 Tax=Mollisia scopiformis TaxID=149040 RepID=A0A194XM46_MOLSC|nr:uncharacterized protein LY89DRAFT_681800 [Mollisia scopiformis]KUJ21211.1 hypothetical protein LY89DRAFT_681800 [Mollisia scopiformis]
MDAIGFIASIAQLAGAGLTLSKALYEYSSSVSNAPKKLNDLAQDVQLTSPVLERLSEVFTEATMRAFVRPGALHTAQEAIAGCSDIFGEMRVLIEEGRKGMGKFMLPFKESKIQLLNARLASLKSTLQLLLQVLQYASSVNVDPSVSQFSLNGSWLMSQFKTLIDEREEAKRNLELLKAEIGSINSGVGEPSNSSSKPQEKPSTTEEIGASDAQSTSIPKEQAGLVGNGSVSLSAYLPVTLSSTIPASQDKKNEQKPTTALSRPGSILSNESRRSFFCWPCSRKVKSHELAPYPTPHPEPYHLSPVSLSAGEGTGYLPPTLYQHDTQSYSYASPPSAYANLERYGPEGITEMSGATTASIPRPAELGDYF